MAMNQKVVVYIILSAILLYLYYKRGDLAIFAAFVAVVVGTLIPFSALSLIHISEPTRPY